MSKYYYTLNKLIIEYIVINLSPITTYLCLNQIYINIILKINNPHSFNPWCRKDLAN